MIATVGLFGVAVLLACAAGVVLEALLRPRRGFRLRPRTPAIGFAVCVLLLVSLGSVWPTSRTAWGLVVVLTAAWVVAFVRVYRAGKVHAVPPPFRTREDRASAILLSASVFGAMGLILYFFEKDCSISSLSDKDHPWRSSYNVSGRI